MDTVKEEVIIRGKRGRAWKNYSSSGNKFVIPRYTFQRSGSWFKKRLLERPVSTVARHYSRLRISLPLFLLYNDVSPLSLSFFLLILSPLSEMFSQDLEERCCFNASEEIETLANDAIKEGGRGRRRRDRMERRVSHGRGRDENGKSRNWKEELFSINREISLVCHSITLPDTYPVTHMYSYTLEEYYTFLLLEDMNRPSIKLSNELSFVTIYYL